MLHSPTLLAGLTTCIALKAYRIISTDAAKTTCQVLAVAVYVHFMKHRPDLPIENLTIPWQHACSLFRLNRQHSSNDHAICYAAPKRLEHAQAL